MLYETLPISATTGNYSNQFVEDRDGSIVRMPSPVSAAEAFNTYLEELRPPREYAVLDLGEHTRVPLDFRTEPVPQATTIGLAPFEQYDRPFVIPISSPDHTLSPGPGDYIFNPDCITTVPDHSIAITSADGQTIRIGTERPQSLDGQIIRIGDDRVVIRGDDDRTVIRTNDDRTVIRTNDDRIVIRDDKPYIWYPNTSPTATSPFKPATTDPILVVDDKWPRGTQFDPTSIFKPTISQPGDYYIIGGGGTTVDKPFDPTRIGTFKPEPLDGPVTTTRPPGSDIYPMVGPTTISRDGIIQTGHGHIDFTGDLYGPRPAPTPAPIRSDDPITYRPTQYTPTQYTADSFARGGATGGTRDDYINRAEWASIPHPQPTTQPTIRDGFPTGYSKGDYDPFKVAINMPPKVPEFTPTSGWQPPSKTDASDILRRLDDPSRLDRLERRLDRESIRDARESYLDNHVNFDTGKTIINANNWDVPRGPLVGSSQPIIGDPIKGASPTFPGVFSQPKEPGNVLITNSPFATTASGFMINTTSLQNEIERIADRREAAEAGNNQPSLVNVVIGKLQQAAETQAVEAGRINDARVADARSTEARTAELRAALEHGPLVGSGQVSPADRVSALLNALNSGNQQETAARQTSGLSSIERLPGGQSVAEKIAALRDATNNSSDGTPGRAPGSVTSAAGIIPPAREADVRTLGDNRSANQVLGGPAETVRLASAGGSGSGLSVEGTRLAGGDGSRGSAIDATRAALQADSARAVSELLARLSNGETLRANATMHGTATVELHGEQGFRIAGGINLSGIERLSGIKRFAGSGLTSIERTLSAGERGGADRTSAGTANGARTIGGAETADAIAHRTFTITAANAAGIKTILAELHSDNKGTSADAGKGVAAGIAAAGRLAEIQRTIGAAANANEHAPGDKRGTTMPGEQHINSGRTPLPGHIEPASVVQAGRTIRTDGRTDGRSIRTDINGNRIILSDGTSVRLPAGLVRALNNSDRTPGGGKRFLTGAEILAAAFIVSAIARNRGGGRGSSESSLSILAARARRLSELGEKRIGTTEIALSALLMLMTAGSKMRAEAHEPTDDLLIAIHRHISDREPIPAELSFALRLKGEDDNKLPFDREKLKFLLSNKRVRNQFEQEGEEPQDGTRNEEVQEEWQAQNDNAGASEHQQVHFRPVWLISPGETLTGIADRLYDDPDVGWVIADLNRNHCQESWIDGKRVVELQARQKIELPVAQDIQEFYRGRRRGQDAEHLITIVNENAIDRELVASELEPLLLGQRTPTQPIDVPARPAAVQAPAKPAANANAANLDPASCLPELELC
jgi:hypothetical protein